MRAKYMKVNRNKQQPLKRKKNPLKRPNRQTIQTCRNIKKTQNNRL